MARIATDLESRAARANHPNNDRRLKKQVAELDEENKKLVRDSARLEGRVTELKRVIQREFLTTK